MEWVANLGLMPPPPLFRTSTMLCTPLSFLLGEQETMLLFRFDPSKYGSELRQEV
jgi:hypothetical protein